MPASKKRERVLEPMSHVVGASRVLAAGTLTAPAIEDRVAVSLAAALAAT